MSDRARAGLLHRVHRGVYAVGNPRLTFEGRCMAAVLAAGPGVVISHRTAAELWRMLRRGGGPVHVTVRGSSGRSGHVGVRIHRSTTLGPHLVTSRDGIPVTRPARTIRDVRGILDDSLHLHAVRRSLDLDLISRDQLPSLDLATRSELERRFLAVCRRHGIPRPQVNATVAGYEVDFLWVDHRLVVETDGWSTHGDRVSFERDRERDARLQALGYRVIRFTYKQVAERSGDVVARLRTLMDLENPA